MSTLTTELEEIAPEPVHVRVNEAKLSVDLEDDRTIEVPTSWYPRLAHGTAEEWLNYELSPCGIHWPDLDEDISVAGLLLGGKSNESGASLKWYFEQRAKGLKPWLQDGYIAPIFRAQQNAKASETTEANP